MTRDLRVTISFKLSPRAAKALLALLLVAAVPLEVGSESLTLSTTYPSPMGIYGSLITTGTGGVNTILNNNAGNVVLVPTSNATGKVGIGTSSPASKLDVGGGISVGTYAGTTAAPNNGMIVSGNVGIGGVSAPITSLQVAGTVTLGTNQTAGAVGNVQISGAGASPISGRLAFGTDGTGWQMSIAKNQGGTITDLMTVQDNGNLTASGVITGSSVVGCVFN